jgi:WD40 repeat protein
MRTTEGSEPGRIAYAGEDGIMPAISRPPAGLPARLVYVRSFVDSNLWRVETRAPGEPSSSAPSLTIASTKQEYHVRFSPDGRRLAFGSARTGDSEIWTSDADGSNQRPLTSMRAQETMCPFWSPDGQSVLFSSNPEGEFDLYLIPAAGGKPRRVTSHPGIDICGSFSPDGKWIYFSSMRSGDYRIWKMPAAGGDAVPVTQAEGGQPIISPDGRYLFYNPVSILAPVWRVPLSGGEPVKLFDGVVWFNYSVTAKGVYYIDRFEGQTRLQYLNLENNKTSIVARNLGDVAAGLAASHDGKTILFTRMDASADDLMLVENFR